MTCQDTCSSSRTSREAGRDSVVAGRHRTATAAAGLKDTGSIATNLSPHAGQCGDAKNWPRPRQSTGSWFVVEYGSQALDHIGTVLGPTSSAKGTAPLSTVSQEPRRGPESQMWAPFGPERRTLSRRRSGATLALAALGKRGRSLTRPNRQPTSREPPGCPPFRWNDRRSRSVNIHRQIAAHHVPRRQ